MPTPKQIVAKTGQLLLISGFLSVQVMAQAAYNSTNYSINESFIGEGGAVESTSPNYTGQEAIGDFTVGASESTNFSSQTGFLTTDEPRLAFAVNTSSINFGALSTSTTATATSTFSVLNYTAYGYIVKILGSPPVNNTYTLAGMSSTGPSSAGTEQFGINLKANTSPTSFGSDPVQVPSSSFSYGTASSGYSTANNFRYVSGETIAEAPKTSGQTDYTVSYIVNASTTTAGGTYTGTLQFICIGTY